MSKSNNLITSSLLVLVFAMACFMQARLLINWDVSWLLIATKRWLAGGTYSQDFFDPDPPMILYVYSLPVLFAKFTSLSIFRVFPAYIFLLSFICLYLSYGFIARIFKNEAFLRGVWLVSLALAFWIAPVYEFGQRDHIIFMLLMPYALSVIARMQVNLRISRVMAMTIGGLAAIGFGIKPFYLSLFLLIEGYQAIYTRSLRNCLRLETVVMGLGLSLYLLLVYLQFPDYISVVVPYVLRLYPGGMAIPAKILLHNPAVIFCVVTALIALIVQVPKPYRNMLRFLSLLTLGYLSLHLMQKSMSYYHLVPAFSLALVLLIFTFILLVTKSDEKKLYVFSKLIALGLFLFAFYQFFTNVWVIFVFSPLVFYAFFALIFSGLLMVYRHDKVLNNLFIIALVFSISMSLSRILSMSSVFAHSFAFSVLCLTALFALLFPAKGIKIKSVNVLNTVLAIIIFSFPFNFIISNLNTRVEGAGMARSLAQVLSKYGNEGGIAAISTKINNVFPAFQYANVDYGSRFPFLWMLPTLVDAKSLSARDEQDQNFMIDAIAADINVRKPKYVFVESGEKKLYLNKKLDYVPFFNSNKNFQKAWQAYSYVTTVKVSQPVLMEENSAQFDIYRRA